MPNLEEQIKLLVELQGLDTQIFRSERELASVPDELKRWDEGFKERTINLKRLEDGVKMLQVKRKEKEVDLESKEGNIKKLQTQLYQVKTNREYSALEQEIGRIRADDSIIEEEIIKLLDEIDLENQKIVKEREDLKKEEDDLSERKKKREAEASVVRAELARLKTHRTEIASRVNKPILAKYERIVRSKDGLAVVPAVNETCQGCFRMLPPQVINEIRMKDEIILCDNCARILYIEE